MLIIQYVVPIVALLVSFLSLYFIGLPVYCQYLDRKEMILLTAASGKMENGKISLFVIYSNVKYRQVVISSACLALEMKDSLNRFAKENYIVSGKFANPIVLPGKGQSCIELDYPCPEIQGEEIVDIKVATMYVNSQGITKKDSFTIGMLYKTNNNQPIIEISYLRHQLSGNVLIETTRCGMHTSK